MRCSTQSYRDLRLKNPATCNHTTTKR